MSGIWVGESRGKGQKQKGRNQMRIILTAKLNSPTVFMKQNGDSFENQP